MCIDHNVRQHIGQDRKGGNRRQETGGAGIGMLYFECNGERDGIWPEPCGCQCIGCTADTGAAAADLVDVGSSSVASTCTSTVSDLVGLGGAHVGRGPSLAALPPEDGRGVGRSELASEKLRGWVGENGVQQPVDHRHGFVCAEFREAIAEPAPVAFAEGDVEGGTAAAAIWMPTLTSSVGGTSTSSRMSWSPRLRPRRLRASCRPFLVKHAYHR